MIQYNTYLTKGRNTMKLKTQELIRTIELNSYLGLVLVSIILNNNVDIEQLTTITKFLEHNQININDIRSILSSIYTLDYITSFRTQTITTEYKELKYLYDEVINNIGIFLKDLNIIEPISIFTTYVYMYRSGYFSYNKEFTYSTDMKDFAKLNGLDVISGKGVCRSISSMLTDIYNKLGMPSYNLMVNSSKETLNNINELCPIKLNVDNNSNKFIKFIEIITSHFPLANHLITTVEQNNKNYIFDPTNDCFLQYTDKNRLGLANNTIYSMTNYTFGLSGIIANSLGQFSNDISLKNKRGQLQLSTITNEEYEKKYLEALKTCLENKELFEEFHQNNKTLIDDIYVICKEQNGLIKRLIPIIPNKTKDK